MSTRDADGLSFEAKSSQSRSSRHPATVVSDALVLVHPKAVNRKIHRAAAATAKEVMSVEYVSKF